MPCPCYVNDSAAHHGERRCGKESVPAARPWRPCAEHTARTLKLNSGPDSASDHCELDDDEEEEA